MDAEDAVRISKHLATLLAALQRDRVLTNTQVRAIAGSRGMARVSELKHLGHAITVRKLAPREEKVNEDTKNDLSRVPDGDSSESSSPPRKPPRADQCESLLRIEHFAEPVRCVLRAGHPGRHGGGGCEWA